MGWYSTETETTRNSQDWTIQVDQYFRGYARTYGKDLAPIHLLVDVSLRKPTVGITAHMLIPNDLLIRCGRRRQQSTRVACESERESKSKRTLTLPRLPVRHTPPSLFAGLASCSPRKCR